MQIKLSKLILTASLLLAAVSISLTALIYREGKRESSNLYYAGLWDLYEILKLPDVSRASTETFNIVFKNLYASLVDNTARGFHQYPYHPSSRQLAYLLNRMGEERNYERPEWLRSVTAKMDRNEVFGHERYLKTHQIFYRWGVDYDRAVFFPSSQKMSK